MAYLSARKRTWSDWKLLIAEAELQPATGRTAQSTPPLVRVMSESMGFGRQVGDREV
ncbi:unnamed protein product [Diplocarpon coronariae]